MTIALASLARLVLPSLPGCPEVVATQALNRAAREFCRRAKSVRRSVVVDIPADSTSAGLNLPAGDEACWLLSVDGEKQEQPGYELQGNTVSHAATGPHHATLVIAVQPAEGAAAIDGQLANYVDAIAAGAMSTLMLIPGKEWSDVQLAAYHRGIFERGVAQAVSDMGKAHGGRRMRTRGSFL